ncbi:hypothetical protein [Nocardiopsis xinjiangensis]|uniref:hypothetical protein n=1 Tax=Nocardiopsis xinjiangensis TaxID=124285 RepID=UPI00034815E7|nr:hypothetical protein [Nocardiopsis xinjiangensis]
MAPPQDTARLQRLPRVTANYNGLQGLVLVPMGILLLLSGAVTLAEPRNPLFVAGLVPAFATMGLLALYYRRRFGRVRSGESGYQSAAAAMALTVFFLLSVPVNRLIHSPDAPDTAVWLTGVQAALTLATVSVAGPLLRRRPGDLVLSRHWQILSLALLCAALVPVGLFVEGGHPLNTVEHSWPGLAIAFGAALLIGGLSDHRLLVRSLAPSPATAGER